MGFRGNRIYEFVFLVAREQEQRQEYVHRQAALFGCSFKQCDEIIFHLFFVAVAISIQLFL